MVKVISRSAAAAGPLVRSTVAPTPTEPASRSRRDSALAVVLVMIFFTAAAAGFSHAVFIVRPLRFINLAYTLTHFDSRKGKARSRGRWARASGYWGH